MRKKHRVTAPKILRNVTWRLKHHFDSLNAIQIRQLPYTGSLAVQVYFSKLKILNYVHESLFQFINLNPWFTLIVTMPIHNINILACSFCILTRFYDQCNHDHDDKSKFLCLSGFNIVQ